ncbi:hypothetical protein CLOSTASPAR_05586 [[Clostridium] asparagiforme DSM 15981]|uniref:Uncharacterized protein n=1 Tax=[Clostridium] asparagiforme DSM 15981 TaxID=518636 RepID=C0D8I8_9FIRM|nr:hypothetical protein CLOSTASPAR_05586 [[Clostridium] asparagiforme DSM 15981]
MPVQGIPLWIEICFLKFMLQEKALGIILALFSLSLLSNIIMA